MSARLIIATATLFIVASIAQAQKMVVDVDKTVDFKTFKSYSWAPGQVAPKPTTAQMLVDAVEREFNSRGLVKNDKDPDLQIVIMAAADMDLQGVGPTWNNERYRYWGGYGNPAALMTVTKGTLLIDLVETKNKHSIWRGVARDIFVAAPSGNPEKDNKRMQELVSKTVGKMFAKYPVKSVK